MKLREQEDSFVYQGKRPLGKLVKRFWLCSVLSLILQIAAGCIPSTGLVRTAYVLVPYGLGLCASIFLIRKVTEFTFADAKMERSVYHRTAETFDAALLAAGAMAVLTAAAELIRLFITAEKSIPASIAVILLEAAASGCMAWFKYEEADLIYKEIPAKKK